jgi:hypothetical protein
MPPIVTRTAIVVLESMFDPAGFMNWDFHLRMPPSELLAPEYIAGRIYGPADGKRKSGQSVAVYS